MKTQTFIAAGARIPPLMCYFMAAWALAMLPAISPSASADPIATLLVAGLEGGSGSTVGPGGALFVTETHRFHSMG
jgi:hypothetical protein